jgi:Uncharacterized protein involved in tolerance to divalent cations
MCKGGPEKMVKGTNARIVLVTCGTLAEGRKIARAVVAKRLAACVNVIPCRWNQCTGGREIESAKEFLLVIKTTARRLKELEKEITRLHRYDVPEFLVLRVDGGSKAYLEWLLSESARLKFANRELLMCGTGW